VSIKISFFSVFSPNIGGVASFSDNLCSIVKLDQIKLNCYDYSDKSYVSIFLRSVQLFFIFFKNEKRIISVSSIRHALIAVPGIFSGKTILVLHNALWFHNYIFRLIICSLSINNNVKVICVNNDVNNALINSGFNSIFMPGYFSKRGRIFPINSKRPTIAFTIWKLDEKLLYKTYGFQTLKEIIDKISNLDFVLKIYIGKVIDHHLLNFFYRLSKNVEIVIGKIFIENSMDVFILLRTNKIDGYGLVLAESIDLGIYVLATDVCERPKGTFIFNGTNEVDKAVTYIISLFSIFPRRNKNIFHNCSSIIMNKTLNSFFK
jgi:hypothetical protein